MLSHSEDFQDFHFLLVGGGGVRTVVAKFHHFFCFDRSIGSTMPHDRKRTPPHFNVTEYAPVICVEDSCLEFLKASSFPRFLEMSMSCILLMLIVSLEAAGREAAERPSHM